MERSLELLQMTHCAPAFPLHSVFVPQIDGQQRQPKLCCSLEEFMGPETE